MADMGGQGSEQAAETPRWRGSVRVGALAGIEVRVHWSWTIVAVLMTTVVAMLGLPMLQPTWPALKCWVVALAIAGLFFTSLLLHELAHSVVARRRGVPVHGITLFLFGGVSALGSEPRTAWDEFCIAIVGPLASFALMFLFGGLYFVSAAGALEVPATIFFYVAMVNGVVATFNLLPGFPLDGGRVLRAIVWGVKRNLPDATRVAGWAGRVVAAALMALGLFLVVIGGLSGAWVAFLGFFLWNAAMPKPAAA